MLPSSSRAPLSLPVVETTHVTSHGLRQRVLVAGSGPPLLLLHGIAGSADEYLDVLPRLGARYRVVAPDAPGHGHSDKPRGYPYDVAAYVRSTLGVMDALDMAHAPVVAVSGGGVVALAVALDYPDRADRLVLVDSAGLGRDVAWSYRLASLPFTGMALRRASRAQIESFGRALCYNPDCLPHGWVERRQRIWATPGAIDAFVQTARAGVGISGQTVVFADRLREVRQPTLILWGRQDPIIPVRHGVDAAHAIPGAQLHIFERCGHMPVWEYPQEFARQVLEFLDEQRQEEPSP